MFDEIKREKKIAKAVKTAAIAAGAGIGLFILQPLLPDIDDTVKADNMKHLFSMLALGLLLYGLSILGAALFKKDKVLFINGLMMWLVVPTLGLWFVMEAYEVLIR